MTRCTLGLRAFLEGVVIVGATLFVVGVPADSPNQLPIGATTGVVQGVDSVTGLEAAARRIERCAQDCAGVVYFWSQRMPLSRLGITEISEAARRLELPLFLVSTEDLDEYANPRPGVDDDVIPLADGMLAAGALAHAPALVVFYRGELVGPAIQGYKTADTYEGMIGKRLSAAPLRGPVGSPASKSTPRSPVSNVGRPLVDYEAVGRPGAYFRSVPGRRAVAYESGQRVYLLDLGDGQSRLAPGEIDFVPTPDGRYFVTPGLNRDGLSFYDADEVFDATSAERPGSVEPFFTDSRMRDQYPSVGILEQGGSRTVYRVLTSWFSGVVYRDYAVDVDSTGASRVRPIAEPVVPCRGMSLSIPIMSQDGLEVAARDESTGTTKILRMLPGGRCDQALDLGVQTSKVSWHRTGRLLAFAVPPVRRRGRDSSQGSEGLFLYDRAQRRMTRIADSQAASMLAFPDFVGDDSVVFLIPGQTRGASSVFRVVAGIR